MITLLTLVLAFTGITTAVGAWGLVQKYRTETAGPRHSQTKELAVREGFLRAVQRNAEAARAHASAVAAVAARPVSGETIDPEREAYIRLSSAVEAMHRAGVSAIEMRPFYLDWQSAGDIRIGVSGIEIDFSHARGTQAQASTGTVPSTDVRTDARREIAEPVGR